MNAQQNNDTKRTFTGTVTKLLENFGFIDDNVFFQLSVVKGGCVRVNDKVYVECQYSEHLPFKWNATKVQTVQTHAPKEENAVNYYTFAPYYYGQQRNEQNNCQQLQYTSTPGAAFVSPSITPYNQQLTKRFKKRREERQNREQVRDQMREQNREQRPKEARAEEVERRPRERRYEPVNVPKLSILKSPLNVYDIKQRYSPALHVPSDLKEVVVNPHFAMPVKDIPKPVVFRVSEHKTEVKPPEVETSYKSTHKYAVKVLIVSLPSMADVYDRVFGSDCDTTHNSKAYFLHFNKLMSFLVTRNANDGFSLIGGKFNATIDGFLSDEEPNLIATAIRVVYQHTALNLSKCRKWTHVATFVYNRDNSVDPISPPLEYTRVYMPHVTANDAIYDNFHDCNFINDKNNVNQSCVNVAEAEVKAEMTADGTAETTASVIAATTASVTAEVTTEETTEVDSEQQTAFETTAETSSVPIETSVETSVDTFAVDTVPTSVETTIDTSSVPEPIEPMIVDSVDIVEARDTALLSRLNDMKVAELRAELETRGVRVTRNLKKAELIQKLRQVASAEDEDVVSDENKGDWWTQKILSKDNVDVDAVDVDKSVKVESDEQKAEQKVENDDERGGQKDEENGGCDAANGDERSEEKGEIDKNGGENVEKTDEKAEVDLKRKENGEDEDIVGAKKARVDGCIHVRGADNLTVITLHEALNHQRYDQFEMSIVSELVREALIQHFSRYILTTLVHNYGLKKEDKVNTEKECQYVNLAFTYFDSNHCGFVMSEDLAKLLNNANLTLSKRAFNALVSDADKVHYKLLQEPKHMLQFEREDDQQLDVARDIVEKNGIVYNVQQLIDQSENDEKSKVEMSEQLINNKIRIDQLKEQIKDLEARHKKMTHATEKQNDEICALKRDKDALSKKYESIRRCVETTMTSFNELIK